MVVRRTVLAAFLLALSVPASAPARQAAQAGPKGLKGFLLSYGEPAKRTFPRTPSFAWKPVARTNRYEFQLATASSYRENSILWSSDTLKTPVVSVPLALPWATGRPYAFYARVRAITQQGPTRWSKEFGFNVRWPRVPAELPAPNGVLRWTPIEGASGYEVWEIGPTGTSFLQIKTHIVSTNVTDMRDWFTLHPTKSWVGTVTWRVRAIRSIPEGFGTAENRLASTTYGPWSPLYSTNAFVPTFSQIALGGTVSDVVGTRTKAVAHSLMPAFSWNGNSSPDTLYRAYIFSDRDCVQPVLTGSIVGSPAWVPRLSGALELPTNESDLPQGNIDVVEHFYADGVQTNAIDYAFHEINADENLSSQGGGAGTGEEWRLGLWDRKWPNGRYYWTVVPVQIYINIDTKALSYTDMESPQDACASGRIGSFGKVSKPVPTRQKKAYVVGLSATGRLQSIPVTGYNRVYGSPLLTWSPVLGAQAYEIQWSQKRSPFQAVGNLITPSTSAQLSLSPGTWFYRVRGLDQTMPTGSQGMAWSRLIKLKIARPVFRVKG